MLETAGVKEMKTNQDFDRIMLIGMWLLGAAGYDAMCYGASRVFVGGMQYWARHIGTPEAGLIFIRLNWGPTVVSTLFFWGALYAAALAKPSCFGHVPRILKHLAGSLILCLLGCVFSLRVLLLKFPNFKSSLVTSAFPFAVIGVAALCFVFAMAVWVHLAFGNPKTQASQNLAKAGADT